MREKIYIIDGSALVYRAHYAFSRNPLTNDKGENISAIYGTFNMFFSFIKDFKPDKLAVTFDQKGGSFRNDVYHEYKANRPPMPEDLISQVKIIQEIFQSLNIENLKKDGYEADDIIGSFATKMKKDYEVVIVSGDKDFFQLIDESVTMFDLSKNSLIDINFVQDKLGILPAQMIDYLAIMGDSADNIPGIKGVGKKGAEKLLLEFSSLENIYENIDQIKPSSLQNKLIENKENAFLSQKLATIVTDLQFDNLNLAFSTEKLKDLSAYLKEQQLWNLAERISKFAPKEIPKNYSNVQLTLFDEPSSQPNSDEYFSFDYELIDTPKKLQTLLDRLGEEEIVVIDTETNGLDPFQDELVGISFCFLDEKSFYFPILHQGITWTNNELNSIFDKLNNKTLIGHNLKFDLKFLTQNEFSPKNVIYFDTMIAVYLMKPGRGGLSLEDCAFQEFSKKMIQFSAVTSGAKFSEISPTKAAEYSCEDVFITCKLYKKYKSKLVDLQLYELFTTIEMPLVPVLAQMELNGVYIDKTVLQKQRGELEQLIIVCEKNIYDLAGEKFNLNSPKQMQEILFGKLRLTATAKTKTGFSTSEAVLENLINEHEIVKEILKFRTINKLLSTYINALPKLINPVTKRVHTNFNQAITSTGRLSSSNPNLQNIPVKSDEGKKIRRAFVAQNDQYCIVAADYSQMELKILAALCQDEILLNSFKNNEDVHMQTAKLIFEGNEIGRTERALAKTINFGIIYGMGAKSLAKSTGISVVEAKSFIEKYFEKFKTVKDFIENQIKQATHEESVRTFFGRKLQLPDILSTNSRLKAQAERIAVNMPIQGTASDIIKLAMTKLQKVLPENAKMVLQVHDELVFEIPKSDIENLLPLIKKEMEYEFDCGIKLTVDIKVADNWLDAH